MEAVALREVGKMERYAKMFQNTHKNGVVSHITDYSFRYSETTKNAQNLPITKTVVYMKSYFLKI